MASMHARTTLIAALLLLGSALAQTPHYDTMKIGTPAPDFNLPGVDGRNYGLKDFAQAKLLAIIFTCTHCPTAQAYEERIKKLVEDYAARKSMPVAEVERWLGPILNYVPTSRTEAAA